MNLIDTALTVAVAAHKGQKDKGGNPYILHPIRVALRFDDERHQAVALLHDVLEDSDTTAADLQELFGGTIAAAVVALTKLPNQTYEDFIQQCSKNDIARAVKQADLAHNMDMSRLPQPLTDKDLARAEKYADAAVMLKAIG